MARGFEPSFRYLARALAPHPFEQRSFAGGLNFRDSVFELGAADVADMFNMALDTRGGAIKRLGFRERTTLPTNAVFPGAANTGWMVYFSTTLNLWFASAGDGKLYKVAPDVNGLPQAGWVLVATFTVAKDFAMCDFKSEVVVAHPVDGIFSYDGAVWTNRSVVARGSTIAVWQNKVWAAGADGPRVWFSAIGDGHTWTTATDFNDLREIDDSAITCLFGGQGMDFTAKGGLLAFKKTSAYRINNSGTGAYATIDAQNGAASHYAVAALLDRVFALSTSGGASGTFLYRVGESNGITGFTNVSPKIPGITIAATRVPALVAFRDRIVGSGQPIASHSGQLLEYNPLIGYFAAHAGSWGSGSPLALAFGNGYVISIGFNGAGTAAPVAQVFPGSGGQDFALLGNTNFNIASNLVTRFFDLGGRRTNWRRARLFGRGVGVTVTALRDWDLLAADGVARTWNPGNPANSSTVMQPPTPLHSFGTSRALALRFDETSALTFTDLHGATYGAWALYGVELEAIARGAI